MFRLKLQKSNSSEDVAEVVVVGIPNTFNKQIEKQQFCIPQFSKKGSHNLQGPHQMAYASTSTDRGFSLLGLKMSSFMLESSTCCNAADSLVDDLMDAGW